MKIEKIEQHLLSTRNALKHHKLYKRLTSVDDIKIFMESHVYAVWDFMSLLKALQNGLSCTTLPWKPAKNSATARFINEIVLEEETDMDVDGNPKSHYEMYLDAMQEVGAETKKIQRFIDSLQGMDTILEDIEAFDFTKAEKQFLKFTFQVIKEGKLHCIAAAFTFGREEVIPDMFLQIIYSSEEEGISAYPKLKYYLKRHIELDGDEHGPLALKMIQELCGDNLDKSEEVAEYGLRALEHRLALWEEISEKIDAQTPNLIEA
ncbi:MULTISPECIES: DUF3050 domain-containing protein [Flavobacteriaceae]|uniref:DUF3050 domain-containing protein n=1 Tax=Flavobacteriaceae TaxID=49546 RepID=UPI001490D442|nr:MULTISPECIES: DUF3050 domain-containing protein [Allomuricauda]MDC6366360.1 DUF3050 domain-containing protein [Muricauda sp. AC10]